MSSRVAALPGFVLVSLAVMAQSTPAQEQVRERTRPDRLRAQDVIVAIDGLSLSGCREDVQLVERELRSATPADPLRVEILRGGPRSEVLMTAPLDPAAATGNDATFMGGAASSQSLLAGLELATMSEALGSYFGTSTGALVVQAPLRPDRASGRAALDLAGGDVLLEIDGRAVTSSAQAWQSLTARSAGERVQVVVQRAGKRLSLDTRMPQ